jgi:hypothetical protein
VAAALNLPFSEVAGVDWPRAYGVGVSDDEGVRWLASGNGKRAGFQPATWRRPVSYQAARGQLTAPSATAADRDICEVVVVT